MTSLIIPTALLSLLFIFIIVLLKVILTNDIKNKLLFLSVLFKVAIAKTLIITFYFENIIDYQFALILCLSIVVFETFIDKFIKNKQNAN